MRNILITGGGRGLARATAEKLAQQGHAVILTARDRKAGQRAADEILASAPGSKVSARALDLASLASIREFSSRLISDGAAVDVLFNSAGIMQQSSVRRTTVDGFEETLGVNVLAPFLLTSLLLPVLRRTRGARVVNVTSRLHLPDSRGAPVNYDFEDPQLERGYHPERAYKNSKLAVLWLTYELQRRLPLDAVTVNAVCPGFVPTTGAASTHGFQRFLMRYVLPWMPFARSVEEAASSFVFMATHPSLEGVGGRFYGEREALPSSAESMEEDKARRFFAYCTEVTGSGPWP